MFAPTPLLFTADNTANPARERFEVSYDYASMTETVALALGDGGTASARIVHSTWRRMGRFILR